jgi:hypothetical protein
MPFCSKSNEHHKTRKCVYEMLDCSLPSAQHPFCYNIIPLEPICLLVSSHTYPLQRSEGSTPGVVIQWTVRFINSASVLSNTYSTATEACLVTGTVYCVTACGEKRPLGALHAISGSAGCMDVLTTRQSELRQPHKQTHLFSTQDHLSNFLFNLLTPDFYI